MTAPRIAAPAPHRIMECRDQALPFVRRFVDEAFAPHVSPGAPLDTWAATEGKWSLVFFAGPNGTPEYVIRAFRRRRHAQRLVANQRFLQQHGQPTPQIAWADLRGIAKRRYGFCFVAERFVAAREPVGAGRLAWEMGRLFAGMHGTCRSYRGHVESSPILLRSSLARYLRRQSAKWSEAYRRLGLPYGDAVTQRLRSASPSEWRMQPRLCHGDALLRNVIYDRAGLHLIDLGGVRFSAAPLEVAYLADQFADLAVDAIFLDAYRRAASEAQQCELDRTILLATVLTLVMRCAQLSKTSSPDAQIQRFNRLKFAVSQNPADVSMPKHPDIIPFPSREPAIADMPLAKTA